MTSRRLALAFATLLAASTAATASARPAANPTLIGKVGLHDAYRITLTFTNGRPVKSIPAGTYTLVVHDYSKLHNFAVGSQTQNRRLLTTGIPWVGTKTYRLALAPGRYAFACSAHFQTMNGTFVVTAKP